MGYWDIPVIKLLWVNSNYTFRSANIGVFICLKCCGVHRSLGTHISKVTTPRLSGCCGSHYSWIRDNFLRIGIFIVFLLVPLAPTGIHIRILSDDSCIIEPKLIGKITHTHILKLYGTLLWSGFNLIGNNKNRSLS